MNSPKEVAQNYLATGVAKTKYTIPKMLLLGVLAGMFIALAGVGSTIAPATVASASLAKLVGAAVFPTGIIMVVIAGSELFTGNCLLIIPVMQREIKIRAMIKNWVFVYIGNFIGSLIIALLTVYGGTFSLFTNAASVNLIKTAVSKVSLSFTDAMFRGILCNFLVCIGVWMAFAAKDVVGKIAALFLPIMLFVLSGFEHSVANMFFIPAGLFASYSPAYLTAYTTATGASGVGALTWGTLFTKNLIPVTIGNIIGGAVFVGLAYWYIYLHEAKKPAQAGSHGNSKKKK